MGVAVLTGLPHRTVYPDSNAAPRSAKRDRRTGQRYDTYNAAALIEPGGGQAPWHGKMKMVPLAERIPYAEFFSGLDFLRWDVGMGGWAIGRDTVVFREARSGARFSTQICYESTYPDFVAEYVRRGAEFLTIITIDSWWGHMPGAFQHHRIAVFRAVENRRWIARCAVGGISCYIDPFGRTYDDTPLFSRAVLCRAIGRESGLTAYTRAGNVVGEVSLWISCLLFAAGVGERALKKRRTRLWSLP
jgi:apolipoprotein N-acyltransferase